METMGTCSPKASFYSLIHLFTDFTICCINGGRAVILNTEVALII